MLIFLIALAIAASGFAVFNAVVSRSKKTLATTTVIGGLAVIGVVGVALCFWPPVAPIGLLIGGLAIGGLTASGGKWARFSGHWAGPLAGLALALVLGLAITLAVATGAKMTPKQIVAAAKALRDRRNGAGGTPAPTDSRSAGTIGGLVQV